MSNITVVSQTQRIIVDPASSSVSVINAGPIGPAGPPGTGGGGSDIDAILTANGQLLTKTAGVLAPITRPALASDPAFTTLYVPISVLTANDQILTRTAGVPAPITRANLAADPAWLSKYAEIHVGTAAPGAVADGKLWWDTDDDSILPLTVATRGCTLSRSTTQSIAAGGVIAITWPIEILDADGFHVVNGSDVVIPAGLGGVYSVAFTCTLSGGFTGETRLLINGVQYSMFCGAQSTKASIGITAPSPDGAIITALLWNNGAILDVTAGRLEVWKVA